MENDTSIVTEEFSCTNPVPLPDRMSVQSITAEAYEKPALQTCNSMVRECGDDYVHI